MSRLKEIEDYNYIYLVLFHIGLGFVIYFVPFSATIFFMAAMLFFLQKIILAPSGLKTQEILLACAYFVGAEVLFRMTKGGLSYEASKYLVILFMTLGMFFKGISGNSYPYFMYLILLVPAIIVASITLSFDAKFRTNIAFVLSGPVALGIATLFCYDRKISILKLERTILYILLPCITTTTYLFLYNPTIKDTLSGTASNVATSGGFGPNQVATILGLGMFTIVVRLFMKSPTLILKLINLVILIAMTFRAIVTFSRGGIFAAIIVVAAFLWILYWQSDFRKKQQIIGSFVLLAIAIAVTWTISSNQTEGLIDKRYSNLDASGREKKDISTGRIELFLDEIEGFLKSPFLGIGASRTKDLRVESGIGNLPSHNEIGRLLAEHGFLGIIILLILIIKPLDFRAKNKKNVFFYAFLAFWFATINHSGMRIAAPSFLYALALLNVVHEKDIIHRKQLKHKD